MKRRQRAVKQQLAVMLEPELVIALKVRAAQERTTVSKLIADWVRSWAKPRRRH